MVTLVVYQDSPTAAAFSTRRRRTVGGLTWSTLAGEGQVVIAGDVVPLAGLVPDHDHAVLLRVEVAVWLVRPPVLESLTERSEWER